MHSKKVKISQKDSKRRRKKQCKRETQVWNKKADLLTELYYSLITIRGQKDVNLCYNNCLYSKKFKIVKNLFIEGHSDVSLPCLFFSSSN